MRCPSCGFVSFPHLTTCKKCGAPLPASTAGRRPPVPPVAAVAAPPPLAAAPSDGPVQAAAVPGSVSMAEPRDPGRDTLIEGPPTDTLIEAPPRRPTVPAPSGAASDPDATVMDFTLPRAPAPTRTAPPPPVYAAASDLRPAGFWIRVVAAMVDGIVLWILMLVVSLPLGFSINVPTDINDAMAILDGVATGIAMVALATTIINVLYSVIFVGWCGQTPGKMLLRLKIIRADGGDVDYVKAFIRWVGYWVSTLTLGIGYIMAAFTTNKRALHDIIAGTRVIRL